MEEQLKTEVSDLAERFAKLESSVALISEQLALDTAGRRPVEHADREGGNQITAPTAGEVGSFTELQAEFRSIRDRVAKFKLPPDLQVGDSRNGVSKSDWPKFQVIQRCARFQETTLKLLSHCAHTETVLPEITTIALAQLRYLQEEYTNLLVANQFDDGTARLFQTLQQNPAAFTPDALENLQRAVSIAGARHTRQVGSPGRSRGRGFFPFPAGGRGYRPDLQTRRPGLAGPDAGSADWRFGRGRFGGPPGSRDLTVRPQPGDVTGTFAAE